MSSSPREKFEAKSDARSDRLTTLRKNNEEVLRKQLKAMAIETCKEQFQAFGKCAERVGMRVVISCRAENAAMGACMDAHYDEDKFLTFAKERGFEPAPKPPSMGTWLYNITIGGGDGK